MTPSLKFSEDVVPEPIPFIRAENSASMAAHVRLGELTAILATGIHRLRAIRSALPECTQILTNSSQTGLDQGREFALMGAGLRPESEELDDVH